MAQFRTTADILDLALQNAGEVTNGNSPYETQALNYLNRVHMAIVCGGTIPIGKDSTVEIDETWPWALAKKPMILELQPSYETGTIGVTQGSTTAPMSDPPAYSLAGYHIQFDGKSEWYKVAGHTASEVTLSLDGAYADESVDYATFRAIKIDYDLLPSYITIDSSNNKLQFQEAAGTTLTATIVSAGYTPAQLATEVATALGVTGGTPAYTMTYDAVSRKFTIGSNRAGGAIFVLVGTGSEFSIHKTLGFDDENSTNAASITSTYPLGQIARLVEPFTVHKGLGDGIFGIDKESFQREYPLSSVAAGTPNRFCVLQENEGLLTVRFNSFVAEKTRIEVNYVPVPRDLKDSSASLPLVPRKHCDVLEDAASFYLMLSKSDDRMQVYAGLLQGKLRAMIAQHRGAQVRSGKDFGKIIPRRDLLGARTRRFSSEAE